MAIAIVFTGQGAQRAGMGQDFVKKYSESSTIFDRASKSLDLDMRKLCFEENSQLNLTEYTQPAILTAEIAIFEAMRSHFGLGSKYFAGHSLGEYTALVAADVLDFETALKIVRKRGALMQDAVPEGVGAMAALIGGQVQDHQVIKLIQSAGAEIANYNSTEQIVLSGKREAVEKASAQIKASFPDLTIIPLNVSAPFHCSLMRVIEPEFSRYVETFKADLRLNHASRVLSNFSGKFHTAETLLPNLVSQISGSVKWLANMQMLKDTGADILEIGPARVLAKFFGTLDVNAKAVTDLRSLEKFIVPVQRV